MITQLQNVPCQLSILGRGFRERACSRWCFPKNGSSTISHPAWSSDSVTLTLLYLLSGWICVTAKVPQIPLDFSGCLPVEASPHAMRKPGQHTGRPSCRGAEVPCLQLVPTYLLHVPSGKSALLATLADAPAAQIGCMH